MKLPSLAALLLAAGAPMLAQTPGLTVTKGDSDLTAYGILDAGIAEVAHTTGFDSYHPVSVNPTATKLGVDSATGMYNGGISQTRWGLKGSTGLTDGWRALFVLEGAINIPNGNISNAALGFAQSTAGGPFMSADSAISGQLFSRSAYFGASSDVYGTLTFGRHMSFMLEVIPGYDALQGAQLFTPIGFSGTYGGGGATDNSRIDNAIRYRLKVSEFNLGLMHKFGGAAGSSNARSIDEFQAGYEHGPFGVQFVYQACKDATAVSNLETQTVTYSTTTGINGLPLSATNTTPMPTYTTTNTGLIKVTFEDTKAYMLAVRYQLGKWAFRAGYQKQEFTNPSDPALDASTTSLYGQNVGAVAIAPFTVNGAQMEKDLTVAWLTVGYQLTPRLNLAVGYYHVGQNDFSNGLNTAAGAGDKAGSAVYQSALVDYRWTRAFDIYLGYMNNTLNDGMAAGYTYTNNHVFGLGARFAF